MVDRRRAHGGKRQLMHFYEVVDRHRAEATSTRSSGGANAQVNNRSSLSVLYQQRNDQTLRDETVPDSEWRMELKIRWSLK